MSKHPPTERGPAAQGKGLTPRQTYNVVSDVGAGLNVRLKDNLYQGVATLLCLVVGLVLGLLIADEKPAGLIIGGFLGLLVGILGSGIFLMIYRLIMHARGRHD